MPWPTTWWFRVFFFPLAVASSHPWRGGFRFSDRIKQVCVTCVRLCVRWRIKINLSPILSSLFISYVDIILGSACSYLIFLFYFFSFIQRPFSLLYRWALNGADKRDEIYPISFLYRLFIILGSFLFVLFYSFYFFFLFQEFERSISNRKTCSIFKGFTFHLFNIHTKFKREKLKIFFPSSLPTEKKRCKEINGFIKLRSLFD